MRIKVIGIIIIVGMCKNYSAQSNDTIRTANAIKIVNKNIQKQRVVVTDKDTLIASPTAVMVIKKDMYISSNRQNSSQIRNLVNEADSVIATPTYRKRIKKDKPSK